MSCQHTGQNRSRKTYQSKQGASHQYQLEDGWVGTAWDTDPAEASSGDALEHGEFGASSCVCNWVTRRSVWLSHSLQTSNLFLHLT
jgi:hypothetical protein